MSNLLTPNNILQIHEFVVDKTGATAGLLFPGMIEEIVNKPDETLSGTPLYPDIYSKGATLLESLIRFHPFIDGNKRTALMTLIEYLRINGYSIVLPLSSVRLTVKIAMNTNQGKGSIERMVDRISKWIKRYTFKTTKIDKRKIRRAFAEFVILRAFAKLKLNIVVSFLILSWFAYDIYPREAEEIRRTSYLLSYSVRKTMQDIGEEIGDYL